MSQTTNLVIFCKREESHFVKNKAKLKIKRKKIIKKKKNLHKSM